MESVVKHHRCKKCNSTQTYIRRITNEKVCTSCGYVEPLNKEEEQE